MRAVFGLFLLAVALACRRAEDRAASGAKPAAPLFRLEGRVTKPAESDHSGILIFCAGTSYLAYSDEGGSYSITGVPPGRYHLRAQHSDYKPVDIADVTLVEGVDDPAKAVRLPERRLEPRESPGRRADRILCSIAGVVRLRDAENHSGIVVRAVGTDFRTVTDAAGFYQLLRLDPGQYTLVFEKEGYKEVRQAVRLESADLGLQENPVYLEPLLDAASARTLSGTVVFRDRENKPVSSPPGSLVYIEGTTLLVVPNADGSFRFEGLSPARYTVTALAPGFLSRDRAEADLTQAAEVSVTLTLESVETKTSATGVLTGRVLKDEPQDPLAGTVVGLVETGAMAMTDASGGYVFPNVPAGVYTLVAQCDGYKPGALEQVIVGEGQQAQAVDLILEKRRDFPRILFTVPANGTENVVIREVVPLQVRFSKKMKPESLRAAFAVEPKVAYRLYTGREHAQSDYDRLYVELYGFGPPETSLRFHTTYSVMISTAATDEENLPLEQPYRFSFRTGRASVVGTQPGDGARDVFLDQALFRLIIYFNAPLDPNTLTPDKIRIRPLVGNVPQLALVTNPRTGWSEVTVATNWEKGVRYTVTLNSGIRTVDGSSISNLPYTFSFTTSAGRPLTVMPTPLGRRR